MHRLRFNAPPHHSLLEDGQVIHGGEDFTVDDEARAMSLLTDPHVNVIEAPAAPAPDEHVEPEPERRRARRARAHEVPAAPDPDDQQDEPEAD